MIFDKTIFVVETGGTRDGVAFSGVRYFKPGQGSEAAAMAAYWISEAGSDPGVTAAWVNMRRLPDSVFEAGMFLLAWTLGGSAGDLASNGYATVEEALA